MAYTHPVIEALFLLGVTGIWAMIFYQMLFAFLGIRFRAQATREAQALAPLANEDAPPVSILIPAHNEEIVIERTVQSLLDMEYPADKFEIIVINDGSTDGTAKAVEALRRQDSRVRLYNIPAEHAAQGKGSALNLGIEQARHRLIAVYDADNTPQPDSLRRLVAALLQDGKAVSAFGKFRTRNRTQSLLSRFINLETLCFQFMIQAGRYSLFKLAILPGTNFIIYRHAVKDAGGWDPKALTEDTELSIRLYRNGGQIRYVPDAVTWEEEPWRWRVWLRQRTRWVRGNFYVVRKYLLASIRDRHYVLAAELLHLFLLYYLFLLSILASHLFFVLCGTGLIAVLSPGPYLAVWTCAFLLFMAQVLMVCTFEGEASWKNLGLAALMYFTYCQGWILVVFRALYQEHWLRGRVHWEKTPRSARAAGAATKGD